MTALVQTALDKDVPADPQRHPRGLRPRRPRAGHLLLDHRLRGPGHGRSARSSATASTRSSTARPRCSSPRPRPAPPARRSSRRPSRRRSPPPRPTPRSSPPSSSATAPRPRPTSATRSRATPDVNAVFGQNDEGALGAIGAFKAAGKELPCLTEAGGNDEVLAAVEAGEIYASVALQFEADMAQSFDALVAMIDDPEADGRAADRAAGSREGRRLTIMTSPDVTQTSDGRRGGRGRPAPAPAPVPTGHDVPAHASRCWSSCATAASSCCGAC